MSMATTIFAGTSVQVTTQGRKHLGEPLGSQSYVHSHVKCQVEEWVDELNQPSTIACIHPHAAYCAYIHELKRKWLYLARTTPNTEHLLQPLQIILRRTFIPSLTGRPPPDDLEREMISLPVRLCRPCNHQPNSDCWKRALDVTPNDSWPNTCYQGHNNELPSNC